MPYWDACFRVSLTVPSCGREDLCETVSHAIETRCAASGLHLIHSSMFNHAPLREFFGTIHALYNCGEVFETQTLLGWVIRLGGRAEESQ